MLEVKNEIESEIKQEIVTEMKKSFRRKYQKQSKSKVSKKIKLMKIAKNSKHKQKNYLINLILISTPLEKTITAETVNFILECLMTNLRRQ